MRLLNNVGSNQNRKRGVLMAEEFDNEVKEEKQYVLPGGEGGMIKVFRNLGIDPKSFNSRI